jgi:O-succinylhomoserine sulfhydrylase
MAAMTAAMLCQLSAGDHVVAGRAAFGSCRWLTDTLLPRFGITSTIIDARDTDAWARAIRPETKLFFFETPANPDARHRRSGGGVRDRAGGGHHERGRQCIRHPDAAAAAGLWRRHRRPFRHQDDGRAGARAGGAVCGSEDFILNTLLPFTRNTGPTLSAFNAWVVLKGLETLDLRIRRQSENALQVARFLEERVPRILYPNLPSHPQHELAMRQMAAGGTILSLFVDGGRAQAHALLDALELVDISNNIGDSRSLMTHPSSTTHAGLTAEVREEMGVTEGMLRLNVGLEDPLDVIEDLDRALGRGRGQPMKAFFPARGDHARAGRAGVGELPGRAVGAAAVALVLGLSYPAGE